MSWTCILIFLKLLAAPTGPRIATKINDLMTFKEKLFKHEDPFNNHFLKVGKRSSTVEMRRKVYRLAPVTLTEKEQTVHQRRSSRAYQWKRTNGFPQRMRLSTA
ncbi:unnamed protein product [Brassica rapa]|uniref:Uncharacterized protein n=2 Tax=Brassica TaxID=3705 RepID=A0A8D9HM22_BRACM|nr:unnamed protein product [Brassica napus]CAG7902085.1 unnamed protein product [Brassica rapa]